MVVDGLTGGRWRDSELVTKLVAEVRVHAEGLRDVALDGEGAHEELVTAFSKGGQGDEFAAGPQGRWELGPTDAQPGGGVGFKGPNSKIGELVALIVDPGCLLSGQKLTLGDEQSHQ